MTDKDIIRIEGCIKGEKVLCLSCPYRDQYPDCRKYVIRDIFDVAKRQKAEIERLRTDYGNMAQHALILIGNARNEAVKEFAEEYLKQLECYEEYDELYIKTIRDDIVFLTKSKGVLIVQ